MKPITPSEAVKLVELRRAYQRAYQAKRRAAIKVAYAQATPSGPTPGPWDSIGRSPRKVNSPCIT